MSKAAFHGKDYVAAARQAARAHGLDEETFVRQIRQESQFNPNARSPKGALGIAQIMPDTARAWGVDPMNPTAALNAAAKNMAAYVKQFGSYRNALIAYNAGPGAVGRSKLPDETTNYINVILGGKGEPSSPRPAASRAAAASSTTVTGGGTTTDTTAAVLDSLMSPAGSHGGFSKDILSRLTSGKYTKTEPIRTSTTVDRAARASASPAAGGSSSAGLGPLKELFWQGQGGVDVKNGVKQAQGFVSGHTDHVHVASGPKTVVELGKLAQSMGLHVGENPHFGGVHPVHVNGSFHYKGEAIDVSGDPARMAHFAATVAHKYGLKVKG
jgi:hypothetical protein